MSEYREDYCMLYQFKSPVGVKYEVLGGVGPVAEEGRMLLLMSNRRMLSGSFLDLTQNINLACKAVLRSPSESSPAVKQTLPDEVL